MASKSNTQRTLTALKNDPNVLRSWIVEKWQRTANPMPSGIRGARLDMFGIIDIVSLDRSKGVRGIQSTGSDFYGHRTALLTDPDKRAACMDWLSMPGTTLELWGWRKKKNRWAVKTQNFTLMDFLF